MSAHCVLLSGGVGGAKLALGMSRVVPGDELAVLVTTGDDFRHRRLAISPDLDTELSTLADAVTPATGWGRRDETWRCMDELERLGGDTWFRLGDRDLATHALRTQALADGANLSAVTARLCAGFGVAAQLLPVTDEPLATLVHTAEGVLPFQAYFVRCRAEPRVTGLEYAGAAAARPAPGVLAALADPALQAVIIAPSNPWLSIDPMRAVPGLESALRASGAPVIAVSPIVGGRALKGPTAKIMAELGLEVSALAVARHYRGLVDGFILDTADAKLAPAVEALGPRVLTCNTIMTTLADKTELARAALNFAAALRKRSR